MSDSDAPQHLELRRHEGLVVRWSSTHASFFPLAFLRRMSPSADARALRESLASNPLTVIPTPASSGPLSATSATLVGNYAVRIQFSDGHDTGLYSWKYLREIDPHLAVPASPAQPS